MDQELKFELTNLDKVFFPEKGYTKGDLVEYYKTISKFILPYLKNRPESLLRQPNGYKDKGFFQKDMDEILPSWVDNISLYSEAHGGRINYMLCNDLDTLLYMVQLGVIEINPWNSTIKNLEKPDWLVIDLDPEGVDFDKVIKTAQTVEQICNELNIASYPKTSGKTGLHIYIPMGAKYNYNQVRNFAHILVTLVNQKLPRITSLERHPQKRRHRVYLDYLQNSEGQTLSAPYSVRPTKNATVSTPLKWDELNDSLDPNDFTINNISQRLKKVGDLWKPVLGKGIDLNRTLERIEKLS